MLMTSLTHGKMANSYVYSLVHTRIKVTMYQPYSTLSILMLASDNNRMHTIIKAMSPSVTNLEIGLAMQH